ncbi:hypothetical protein HDU93_003570 [Gonapodya sp. JEL0774]|nr:hypothetical protein HDU93_003570 [Gonapodya sp. JEL0774]
MARPPPSTGVAKLKKYPQKRSSHSMKARNPRRGPGGGLSVFADPETASPDSLGTQNKELAEEIADSVRKDYVAVDASSLRKSLPLSISQMPRYMGKKVTRAQLLSQDHGNDSEEDFSGDDDDGGSSHPDSSHGSDSDDRDINGEDDLEEDEDISEREDYTDHTDDTETGHEHPTRGPTRTLNSPSTASHKRKRLDDVDGKPFDEEFASKKKSKANLQSSPPTEAAGPEPTQVRAHLNLLDALLEYRIVAQRALSLVARLPPPALAPAYSFLAGEEINQARNAAAEQITTAIQGLANARRLMLGKLRLGSSSTLPESSRSKDLDSLREELALLDHAFKPYRSVELRKWDQRSSVASMASRSSGFSSGLKVFGKKEQGGVVERIEATLREREKLLMKTRVRRDGQDAGLGRIHDTKEVQQSTIPDSHASRRPPPATDPELFDDADLYSYLLRDLIDRRASEPTLDAGALSVQVLFGDQILSNSKFIIAAALTSLALNRPTKVSRPGVDRKASKGRRIRYVVHDKLSGFMVPRGEEAPQKAWEWIGRSLFGQGVRTDGVVESVVDGLRVIG